MRKAIVVTIPLTALSLAAAFAACSSDKKRIVMVTDSGGSGGGSDGGSAGTPCTMDMDPACSDTQYCNTTEGMCIDICPNGPGIAGLGSAVAVTVAGVATDPQGALFHTEPQEAIQAEGEGSATQFGWGDKLAMPGVAYNFITFADLNKGMPTEEDYEAEAFEDEVCTAGTAGCSTSGSTPESAHGAHLSSPRVMYTIGGGSGSDDVDAKALFTSADQPGEGRLIVLGFGKFDPNTMVATELYIGDAGNFGLPNTPTANIMTGSGKWKGSVTDAQLLHIDLSNNTVAADLCTAPVTNLSWDVNPRHSSITECNTTDYPCPTGTTCSDVGSGSSATKVCLAAPFTGRADSAAPERHPRLSRAQLQKIQANIRAWAIAHPQLANRVLHRSHAQ